MEHGSLQNMMAGRVINCPTPEVGMGLTVVHYTDRSAGTVTRVSPSGKTLWYTDDDAQRIDKLGMTDSGQQYAFTPRKDAPERKALLRNGCWKSNGQSLIVGRREAYYDYSF